MSFVNKIRLSYQDFHRALKKYKSSAERKFFKIENIIDNSFPTTFHDTILKFEKTSTSNIKKHRTKSFINDINGTEKKTSMLIMLYKSLKQERALKMLRIQSSFDQWC